MDQGVSPAEHRLHRGDALCVCRHDDPSSPVIALNSIWSVTAAASIPRNYGVELALELIEGFEGDAGCKDREREAALADWLRAQGFAVWQN